MNDIQLKQYIDDIFNQYPLHYLAYNGGSGGEFLITKLRQYSNIYKTEVDVLTLDETNRTILHVTPFLSAIGFSRIDNGDLKDIKNLIYNELYRVANGNFDNAISIINSTQTMLVRDKPNLCKLHLTTNSYFNKSNTWSIFIDNKESYKYINKLRCLKVFNNKCSLSSLADTYKMNFWKLADKLELLDNFIAWATSVGINEVEEIYIACLMSGYIFPDFKDFKELLSVPTKDLYFKYINYLDGPYENNIQFFHDTTINTNRIYFSKLFEKGYLEEMFQVTDDNFSKELLDWHHKNLDAVSKSDLDN